MRLGVLISGRGSNLGAILAATVRGELSATVAVVISNKPEALGLARATEAGVPTVVVRHADHPTREDFDRAVLEELRVREVECVVLAGFMRLVTPVLLDAFPDRVVNVHPSLLPAFPGLDAQAQALAYRVRVTGCTVHLVDAGTDTGPILAQSVVPVLEDDTRASLARRVLAAEHDLLVYVLERLARGDVRVERETGARPRVVLAGRKLFGAS